MKKIKLLVSLIVVVFIGLSCSNSNEDMNLGNSPYKDFLMNQINNGDDDYSPQVYKFVINIKDIKPDYFPSGTSIDVNFAGQSRSYDSSSKLAKGVIDTLLTNNLDGNSLDVSYNFVGITKKIYSNHSINVENCPEYILRFYLKYQAPLTYTLVTNKNWVPCTR